VVREEGDGRDERWCHVVLSGSDQEKKWDGPRVAGYEPVRVVLMEVPGEMVEARA